MQSSNQLSEKTSWELVIKLFVRYTGNIKRKCWVYKSHVLELHKWHPWLWWSSLHLFIHTIVPMYGIHILIIPSSPFPGYITNQLNDNLPVGLLAPDWLESCTDIAEVRVPIPARLNFLRLCNRNCLKCLLTAKIVFAFISLFGGSNTWNSHIIISWTQFNTVKPPLSSNL